MTKPRRVAPKRKSSNQRNIENGATQIPQDWPFDSYLTPELLEANLPELGPLIVGLTKDCSVLAEDYLHGSTLFTRPQEYARTVFGFSLNTTLGARTRRTPSGYAICVHHGTWLQLNLAFNRLLSRPSAIPDDLLALFPKPANQIVPQTENVPAEQVALPLIVGHELKLLYGENVSAPALPPDDRLYACWRQVLRYGFEVLFLHETAHVDQGHVDYRLKLQSQADCANARTERLGIECLADAQGIMRAALLRLAEAKLTSPGAATETVVAIAERRLELFGFASGAVWLLLEALQGVQPHDSSPAYPPAVWRRLFSQAVAGQTPTSSLGIEGSRVAASIQRGVGLAENAWDLLGWQRERDVPKDFPDFIAMTASVEKKIRRAAKRASA
jgi:hypothetical protein